MRHVGGEYETRARPIALPCCPSATSCHAGNAPLSKLPRKHPDVRGKLTSCDPLCRKRPLIMLKLCIKRGFYQSFESAYYPGRP